MAGIDLKYKNLYDGKNTQIISLNFFVMQFLRR